MREERRESFHLFAVLAAILALAAAAGGLHGAPAPDASFPIVPDDIAVAAPRVSFLEGIDGGFGVARLAPGARVYGDRAYTLTEVPAELLGETFIRTANDDADRESARLRFRVDCPTEVLVAHDLRIPRLPAWLAKDFERTDIELATKHARFRLHRKRFAAGDVLLGPNVDNGQKGGCSSYFVIVRPELTRAPKRPTTMADTLPLLAKGDADRGRDLFHVKGGAGCYRCHRLEGAGEILAPDLSAIGARADATFIARSMLDPSADITEGFWTKLFTTRDGDVTVGVVLEETGRGVRVAQADGVVVTLARKDIERRQTMPISAMPAFGETLRARDVADLVAYLMEMKSTAPTAPTAGIELRRGKDRIDIVIDGATRLTYHHADTGTTRPFFANVHTLGTPPLKVSRNHPPIEGTDSTDHATMHPGIWLAFGDIGGADVWRMRARVETIEIGDLKSGTDRASFTARNRYVEGKRVVCEERCVYGIVRHGAGYIVTYDSTFTNDAGFAFGDQEEMGLGIRVATAITVKKGGAMLNSEGGRNEDGTWGRAADWLDYRGMIRGRQVGMTLMSHPDNFRRPWFHSRDYGAAVLNPFGRKAMRQGAKSAVEVRPGERFQFRAGVYVHDAAPGKMDVGAAHRAFVASFRDESRE